ncbi:DUF6714 family protein [Cupriavidus sp. DL-D2]|uniref:DUF6714 family protein n=1 Tax=Cupriavidus sp. DL-D2 TaxID=3144974 RepID=UPI003212AE59
MSKQDISVAIIEAFSSVEPPPEWHIVDSLEGFEPALVEKTFSGRLWNELTDDELDRDPALCFFSVEAFRYFLPAYLLRELDGHYFQQNELAFTLTSGLTEVWQDKLVNPCRYGAMTSWDRAIHRFATLTKEQVNAVVAFLDYKIEESREDDSYGHQLMSEAMKNYWLPRSKGLPVWRL